MVLNAGISLQKAEGVTKTREIYADAVFWLRAEKVNFWLEQNELAAAASYLEDNLVTSSDSVNFVNELQYVALARVLIAQARQEEAIQLLIRLEESPEKGGRNGRLIRILNTHAVPLAAQGEDNEAEKILEKSLLLAWPEGFNGVFLGEEEPMARLLKQMKLLNSKSQIRDYANRLLHTLASFKEKS